jgi:hypothetical protein
MILLFYLLYCYQRCRLVARNVIIVVVVLVMVAEIVLDGDVRTVETAPGPA